MSVLVTGVSGLLEGRGMLSLNSAVLERCVANYDIRYEATRKEEE